MMRLPTNRPGPEGSAVEPEGAGRLPDRITLSGVGTMSVTCDGGGPHSSTYSRILPESGGNSILCYRCYLSAMQWRRLQNVELEEENRFDLPAWESLETYPTLELTEKSDKTAWSSDMNAVVDRVVKAIIDIMESEEVDVPGAIGMMEIAKSRIIKTSET